MSEQPAGQEYDDPIFLIAPDLSFTITHKGIDTVLEQLNNSATALQQDDWVMHAVIFALLCKAEGYTYEQGKSLAFNENHQIICQNIWASFKEYKRTWNI